MAYRGRLSGSSGKSRTARGKKATPKTLKDGSVPEKVIQAQILSWLKETGVLHWRQNSGIVFAGGRAIKLGDSGLPDIVVIVPPGGRMLGLECKSAKGRLRPDQIEFMGKAREAGAHYCVVRNLNQAMDALAYVMGKEAWDAFLCNGGAWPKQAPAGGTKSTGGGGDCVN